MSEHQQVNRAAQRRDEQHSEDLAAPVAHQQDAGFDALLDEIDGLLETNAAEYVRSFVQKGGQ